MWDRVEGSVSDDNTQTFVINIQHVSYPLPDVSHLFKISDFAVFHRAFVFEHASLFSNVRANADIRLLFFTGG